VKVLPPLAAAAAVVAVVAGTALLVGGRADDAAAPSSSPSPAAERLWTGTATLLQTPDGSLTLCGGSILLSLPPAGCGGAPVRGLDPMTVPGAHRYENGTITTPSVRLVGTWDGDALTPTEPPVLAEPDRSSAEPQEIPGPSCPEPAGGWPFDKFDMNGWERVAEYAASQPDAGESRVDTSQRIFTVPFTGDLDRHRAEIAKLYDGPICVELVKHSRQELQGVMTRVQEELKRRGLAMLSGSPGGSGNGFVEVTVVAASPEEQAELESAFDGLLRMDSFLVPV
jgi:hypothetical protein